MGDPNENVEADQAEEAVVESQGQPQGEVLDSGTQDQAAEAVKLSEFAVGNQDFKNLDDLKKAYAELQKGHTQATQKYSAKLKAYEGLSSWLSDLSKDPQKWQRFVSYVNQGDTAKEAAAKVQAQSQPTAQQADPAQSDLRDRLERQEATMEYLEFKEKHRDLDQESMDAVIQKVIDQDEAGEKWTLEMAYRWIMHDENAAKLVSQGQKSAEDAITKGKQARVLGSTPTSAQVQPPRGKQSMFKIKGAQAQNAYILKKMQEMGLDKELDSE